jgi:hypothetical protein
MKTYIGISRDHTGSMNFLAEAARKDYNQTINTIREAAIREGQDTIVSVVKCGHGRNGVVHREVINSSISALKALQDYETRADSTPLFDSVMDLIKQFESLPDANEKSTAFLLNIVTDGGDNSSKIKGYELARKIADLQATDRWTFTFRVPRGHKSRLVNLGIPAGNIFEWEQTERGMEESSGCTQQAYRQYYSARAAGQTKTASFYNTDLASVPKAAVKKALHDVTSQVQFFRVSAKDNTRMIRDFVDEKIRGSMFVGGAFYQLTKTENKVHDGKLIAVRDKRTGKVYSGTEARSVLGLPETGTVKVVPGNHGDFDVFIQSKSVNRKLVGGTDVLYWSNVGRPV